jgi:predicted nucleic acid-binding protein
MKPTLIIDCSIAASWCFADEATDETADVQERLVAEAAVVPPHWHLEISNVLAIAERRKRISAANSTSFVQLLGALDIQVDAESTARTFGHILPLCRSYALTSYDAAYLELALRRRLPLATLDDDLRRAAVVLGVEVLGK